MDYKILRTGKLRTYVELKNMAIQNHLWLRVIPISLISLPEDLFQYELLNSDYSKIVESGIAQYCDPYQISDSYK